MEEKKLEKGDVAYINGAYLKYEGQGKWSLQSLGFDDDMFFKGELVMDREKEPYIYN